MVTSLFDFYLYNRNKPTPHVLFCSRQTRNMHSRPTQGNATLIPLNASQLIGGWLRYLFLSIVVDKQAKWFPRVSGGPCYTLRLDSNRTAPPRSTLSLSVHGTSSLFLCFPLLVITFKLVLWNTLRVLQYVGFGAPLSPRRSVSRKTQELPPRSTLGLPVYRSLSFSLCSPLLFVAFKISFGNTPQDLDRNKFGFGAPSSRRSDFSTHKISLKTTTAFRRIF